MRDGQLAQSKISTMGDYIDEQSLFWGVVLGIFVGAATWLFHSPQRGLIARGGLWGAGKALRQRIEAQDPVADSLAEGKAVARRRRRPIQEAK